MIEDIDNMPVARVESVPFLAVTSCIVVYLYTLVVTKHIESKVINRLGALPLDVSRIDARKAKGQGAQAAAIHFDIHI